MILGLQSWEILFERLFFKSPDPFPYPLGGLVNDSRWESYVRLLEKEMKYRAPDMDEILSKPIDQKLEIVYANLICRMKLYREAKQYKISDAIRNYLRTKGLEIKNGNNN